jgi:hypothetical protein
MFLPRKPVYIRKASRLIPCKGTIDVYFDSHMKEINKLREKNSEVF